MSANDCDDIAEQIARASAAQRFGARTEIDDNGEFQVENEKDEEDIQTTSSASCATQEPERRFIDDRWICLTDSGFLEFVNDSWQPVDPDTQNLDELRTKWTEAGRQTTIVNGVKMVWNPLGQTWIPDVEVNEDFLANYHMSYGIVTPIEAQAEESKNEEIVNSEGRPSSSAENMLNEPKKPLTKQEKLAKKRKDAEEESKRMKGWVELNEAKNTKVYVSNLPTDITEEDFVEFMSKCGVITNDPRTNKPKVKLYRDSAGNLKGDAICCYFKPESVDLALSILDEWDWNGHRVSVEPAKFEIKGEYDPAKKKKRLTADQKKRWLEQQKRAFEWKPEKDRAYRPPSDCTIVLKKLFTLEQMDADPSLIFDLKNEITELAGRYGVVKHVTTNPDGVVTVTFDNVQAADYAVKSLDRIIRKGISISCEIWDGKTKYRMAETAEERARRENAWAEFLGDDEETSDDH